MSVEVTAKRPKLTTPSFYFLFSCLIMLGFGPTCHKMFQCWIQTQFLQLTLMFLLKIFLYYFTCNHMKDGSLIIWGNWESWGPRQVQAESIVTAALWCVLKGFPLSNQNRISKYFFTGMFEILALSNKVWPGADWN